MVAGSLRFLSFLVSCATAKLPMTPWQRQRCLPFVPWLTALSKASRVPSRSISLFPSQHEQLAVRIGQTFAGGAIWYWVEAQAAVRVSPHTVARRMARRCLRVSRWRGNRPSNACSYRQAHRHHSTGSLAPSVSPVTPNPSLQGSCAIKPSQPPALERWASP